MEKSKLTKRKNNINWIWSFKICIQILQDTYHTKTVFDSNTKRINVYTHKNYITI